MFILDSLLVSGIQWTLKTVVAAAEAEMNDDTALREQLLEAEMRREMGEISDDEFAEIETDLLARIREIKERREGGSEPLAMGGAEPIETSPDSRFQIEASVSGDFYEPENAPHTTVIEKEPAEGGIVQAESGRSIKVMDIEPGAAEAPSEAGLPLTERSRRSNRSERSKRSTGTNRTTRTPGTIRTARTARTTRTIRTIRTSSSRNTLKK
jgi:Gas vesicle protein G